jgi:hypothetical protein
VNRALRFTLLGAAVVVLTNVLLDLNRHGDYGRLAGVYIIAFCIWFYLTRLGRSDVIRTPTLLFLLFLVIAVGIAFAALIRFV